MGEKLMPLPLLSIHLSQILDEVGLNELTVQRRQRAALRTEPNITLSFTLLARLVGDGNGSTVYSFGSLAEGTTTFGLNPDVDLLTCFETVNVIQDLTGWKRGKINLLMLDEDTVPGYCRLQLLRSDKPMPEERLSREVCTYDSCNRVIVKNTFLGFNMLGIGHGIPHGPATKLVDDVFKTELDNVPAIRCKSCHSAVMKWRKEHRKRQWPTSDVLQHAKTDGFFLVPMGYKLSQTEFLEWRVSFSLTERRLMFGMNMTQIKCYVVLKMLMKTFVTPYVGESISSYHCKTALFYCIGKLGLQSWREDNLVHCIVKCLELLNTWVADGFCPHFILSESNLFAGKITPRNKCIVQSKIQLLIANIEHCLLLVPIDELGDRLLNRINKTPSQYKVLDSEMSINVCANAEIKYLKNLQNNKIAILVIHSNVLPSLLVSKVQQQIRQLSEKISYSNEYEKREINNFIKFLSLWLGSLMTSISLTHKKGIPRKALQYVNVNNKSDIASLLKLASIFYSSGCLRKAEEILLDVTDRYCGDVIQSWCACFDCLIPFKKKFLHQMYALDSEDERLALVVECVKYSRQEFNCVPKALQYELYRSVGDDMSNRHPFKHTWMVLAAADSLPYMYYLQYITYGQLGKRDNQEKALENLEHCLGLVEYIRYGHRETGWNLLGQCMEQERRLKDALCCYRRSLEVRSRNNAANWHIAILCFKLVTGVVPPV